MARKRTLLEQACAIFELAYVLDNIAVDNRVSIEALSDREILAEAFWVLSLFQEGGTAQSEMLESDDPGERADARKQVRALKQLLARYAIAESEGGAACIG